MRKALLTAWLLAAAALRAQEAVIALAAPCCPGQAAVLYRYDDLYSMRPVRLDAASIGDDGTATLRAPVEGTAKLRLRIGEAHADLYARPGARYSVAYAPPDARTPVSLAGTARGALTFHGLGPLDPNALTADLNARLDAFIAEDLATDEAAGMQAVPIARKEGAPKDTTRRPPTLFVTPVLSEARIDSFEQKVRSFYRAVDDPWFASYQRHAFASLRHGPRANEAELFAGYLSGQPIVYDDPEQARFIRAFFSEQLLLAERFHGERMRRAFALRSADSLDAVLAGSDFLRDARLRELVMIDLLHQRFNAPGMDRAAALAMLRDRAARSAYHEHRRIAANMLWDLTAMRPGERLPPMRLEDLRGRPVAIDSLLGGPVCMAVTATWCTYCDAELQALEQLRKEYGDAVRFLVIALDGDAEAVKRYTKARPGMDFRWLRAVAEQELRDDLRIRAIPAFYLLNDGVLAHAPAPLPTKGLAPVLHRARAGAERDARVKVWDE